MDEYATTALILAAATLLIAALCTGMRTASRTGSLTRNQFIGVRTRATLSSDEAWELGHHAAEPYLLRAANVGFAGAGVTALLAAWSQTSPGVPTWPALALSIIGFVASIVMLLLGATAAHAAAIEVRDALEELS